VGVGLANNPLVVEITCPVCSEPLRFSKLWAEVDLPVTCPVCLRGVWLLRKPDGNFSVVPTSGPAEEFASGLRAEKETVRRMLKPRRELMSIREWEIN